MQIKAFINNQEIDIATVSISIKKQIKDIREPLSNKASFSKPVTALFTPRNAALLGSAFNLNETNGWDKNSRPSARIEVESETVLNGTAKLIQIDKDGYQFTFFDSFLSLDTLIGDDLIRGNEDPTNDLVLSDTATYNFTRTWVRNNYMKVAHSVTGSQLSMGFINYNNIPGANKAYGYYDDYITPALAVEELIGGILGEHGKTITYSTEIEKYIRKMVVPFNGSYKEFTTKWQALSFKSPTYQSDNIHENFRSSEDPVEYTMTVQQSKNEIAGRTTSGFNLAERGNYTAVFNISCRKDNLGSENTTVTPRFEISQTIGYGSVALKFEQTNVLLLDSTATKTTQITMHFRVEAPTNMFMYVEVPDMTTDGELPHEQGVCHFTWTAQFTIDDAVWKGDKALKKQDFLPYNYKKLDLLNDVVKMFNAVIETDGDNIHMTSYKEYISDNNILDWSNKIDGDSIEIVPYSTVGTPVGQYKMASSESFLNTDFEDQFGKGYGDLILSTDESQDTVELSFPSTIWLNAPQIKGDLLTYKTDSEPRILFVYEDQPASYIGLTYWGWDSVNDRSINYFPTFSYMFKSGVAERGDKDNLMLNFGAIRNYEFSETLISTTGNLYKKFYEGFDLSIVYDSVITANTHLTAMDIAEFKYSDLIYISDKQFGSVLCRVNNIVYNTDPTKLSTIELITTDPYNTINRDSQELILTKVNVLPKSEAEETEYQSTLN